MSEIRHYLNKLISEEVLAFETYKVLNTNFSRTSKFEKSLIGMFDDIAEDEYSDHARKLIDYARSLNFEYPKDNSEYVQCASEAAVKAFNIIPTTYNISTILNYALSLEQDAILSYKEALSKAYESDEFDEKIITIMSNNLKDEIEHYEKIVISLEAASEINV